MGTGAVDARDADTGAAPGTPTPRVPRPRAVDVDKPLPVVLAPTEEDLPAALGGSWYADPVEGSIVVVATAAAQGRAVPLSSPVPAPSRALHRTPRRSNKRHALPFSTVSVHTPKFRRVNRAAAGGRAMMSPGDMHASRGAAAGGAPEDVLVSSAGGSPTHRAFRRPPHYIQSTDEIRGVQYDADSDDEAFVESLCQAFPKVCFVRASGGSVSCFARCDSLGVLRFHSLVSPCLSLRQWWSSSSARCLWLSSKKRFGCVLGG